MEDLDCEFDAPDCDTCSKEDLSKFFSERYVRLHSKNILKNEEKTLTSLVAENKSQIALVHTDKTVSLLDPQTMNVVNSYHPHQKEVTNIKFYPENSNLLATSSLDCSIKLFDLRTNKIDKVMHMKGSETKCPVTAFDIGVSDRILCAGTELVGEDSFLLFWDIRGDKLLGGYWQCHSDDISYISFNPLKSDTLLSAATDGLINIFDIRQTSEDDALTYSLNVEDTANVVYWSSPNKGKNILAVTDVQSIQYWDIEGSAPIHSFSREKITKALKRKVAYECYTVPISTKVVGENPIILAASGLEHMGTNCIRLLKLNEKSGILQPHGALTMEKGNFNSIINCALYYEEENKFITVSEDGSISTWHCQSVSNGQMKIKSKKESKRKNPY